MSYYNASWNSCFWFDGCFFNIKSSCLCIVLAIGRLWKSLCTQFVYFLSFYLLLMYILHAIYCVISLSAIINTPQLFQHDLFITLRHFLISFEHMFSMHPWFTSFFFFSLSLFLLFPHLIMDYFMMPCMVIITGCHTSLSDHKGGVSAQSGPPFVPYPAPNPCEWASAPGTCPSLEKGKEWNRLTLSP